MQYDAGELKRIADLWEENQEYLKQHLGYSQFDGYGARWVLMPEVPLPKFNHAGCIRVPGDLVSSLLADGEAFFRRHGLPGAGFLVSPATEPADLGTLLEAHGYDQERNPVMVWDGATMPEADPAVRVELTAPEQAPLLFYLLQRVFFPNANDASLAMGRRSVDISYQLRGLNYIAYYGGRPAGTGMLFPRGAMAGIYNMCTLPEYRGRGVATAILRACMQDTVRLGCDYLGLTPTLMGRPLYERLGFREVYEEVYYATRLL